jgi:hypothetical protein
MEERDKIRREHERWMQQQEELARQRKEKNKKQREERRKKREEEERIREENRRKRYQHFCNLRHVAIQRIEKCISERPNGELFGHAYIFRSYKPETKELIISDPNRAYEDIVINKDIAEKFLRISY